VTKEVKNAESGKTQVGISSAFSQKCFWMEVATGSQTVADCGANNFVAQVLSKQLART
jgi:hypothetical protein